MIVLDKNEMKGRFPDEIVVPAGFCIAGGSIRRWFLGEDQNSDFDFFRINNKEDFELPLDEFPGIKKLYSNIIQDTYLFKGKRLQVIKRKYMDCEEVIESFDFHHCQFVYDTYGSIFTTKKAIISALRGHLSFNNVVEGFELDTLRRAFKYAEQGFKPCAGTIGDLAKMLNKTESDLEEQLIMSPSGGKHSIIHFD